MNGYAGLFPLEAGDQHCLKARLFLTASLNVNGSQEGDVETHLTASVDPHQLKHLLECVSAILSRAIQLCHGGANGPGDSFITTSVLSLLPTGTSLHSWLGLFSLLFVVVI